MKKHLIAMTAAALAGACASGSTIDRHRWQDRLLIVFAPDPSSPGLKAQRADATPDAFAARDLIMIEVIGDAVHGSADAAEKLRKRYGIAPGTFRLLLVGKDGGVKLTSDRPLTSARLVQMIDAMPMRRDEMQRR